MYKANTVMINSIKILSGMIFLLIVVSGQAFGQTSTNSDCLSGPRQYNTLRHGSSLPALSPGMPGTPDLVIGAPYTLPGSAPGIGQPPPVGSGPVPEPVIPGDLGAPSPVPTGVADQTHGNIFSTRSAPPTRTPSIYVPGAGQYSTIRGQQQGVFDEGQRSNGTGTYDSGAGNNGTGTYDSGAGGSGTGTYESGAGSNGTGTYESGAGSNGTGTYESGAGHSGTGYTNSQGGRWNAVGTMNDGGPAANAVKEEDRLWTHAIQPSSYFFQGPLPTVKIFSRYLVMLGVVVATIFMALAGWGMVNGVQHAGSRAIGAAGGLLLLLAGYTIWKVVQRNTMHLEPHEVVWSSQRAPYQQRVNGLNPPIFPYRASNNGYQAPSASGSASP